MPRLSCPLQRGSALLGRQLRLRSGPMRSINRPTSAVGSSQRHSRRHDRQSQHGFATISNRLVSGEDLYDVVVVGGGPAGLSLLAALQHSQITSGLRLALVEGSRFTPFDPSTLPKPNSDGRPFSNRCISLTATSAAHLDKVGIWSRIDHSRVQVYNRMHAWDGITGSKVTFDYDEADPAPPGQVPPPASGMAYMIETANLTSTIHSYLQDRGRVSIFNPATVDDISVDQTKESKHVGTSPWPHVRLSTGQSISARLLVGADGFNSPVRKFAGIDTAGWDYNQQGVVASLTIDHHPSHPRTAYQRFLPTGTIAMLPLPGNNSTIVWSTRPDIATWLKSLPADAFIAMVNAAFRLSFVDLSYISTLPADEALDQAIWRLSRVAPEEVHPPIVTAVQPDSVATFPLRLRQADQFVAERVALVGDAAHVMHPLAGQGLNQGQADVTALVAAIEDAVAAGADFGYLGSRSIGSVAALAKYERGRYAANLAFGGFTDKMNKLFMPASGPIVWARSAGFAAVDALPFLKSWLVKHAVGKE